VDDAINGSAALVSSTSGMLRNRDANYIQGSLAGGSFGCHSACDRV